MMMRALPASLVAISLVGLGAAVVAQTTLPPPNEAGRPTQAKVLVINRDRTEAVPVTVIRDPNNDPPVRASIVGIPTFAIAGTPIVEARRTRQQWEYRTVTFTAGQDVAAVLNALGQDSWEVITAPAPAGTAQSALLKRPR